MYLDRSARHFKPTVSGITEKYRFVTSFRINIQPATGESTILVGGVYGRTFTAFMTYSGLNIEDRVKVHGEATPFRVKAVQNYNYAPLKYVEAILTLPEV